MADQMCAVRTRYGAFTDYFVPRDLVIRLLEDLARDTMDDRREQLCVRWDLFAGFLGYTDALAVARAREAGLDLRDLPDDAPSAESHERWGKTSDFLVWFRNMQVALENGEFEPFINRDNPAAPDITFDFS